MRMRRICNINRSIFTFYYTSERLARVIDRIFFFLGRGAHISWIALKLELTVKNVIFGALNRVAKYPYGMDHTPLTMFVSE